MAVTQVLVIAQTEQGRGELAPLTLNIDALWPILVWSLALFATIDDLLSWLWWLVSPAAWANDLNAIWTTLRNEYEADQRINH